MRILHAGIMKELITMEKYVIDCKKYTNLESAMRDCFNYAKLLQSKPTLSMFIACDDEGKVLEEPICSLKYNCASPPCKLYYKALEKVIFDGWSVDVNNEDFTSIIFNENEIVFYKSLNIYYNSNHIYFISDLTKFKLKLK